MRSAWTLCSQKTPAMTSLRPILYMRAQVINQVSAMEIIRAFTSFRARLLSTESSRPRSHNAKYEILNVQHRLKNRKFWTFRAVFVTGWKYLQSELHHFWQCRCEHSRQALMVKILFTRTKKNNLSFHLRRKSEARLDMRNQRDLPQLQNDPMTTRSQRGNHETWWLSSQLDPPWCRGDIFHPSVTQ